MVAVVCEVRDVERPMINRRLRVLFRCEVSEGEMPMRLRSRVFVCEVWEKWSTR